MRRWLMLLFAVGAVGSVFAEDGKTKVTVEFQAASSRGEVIYRTYCHHCHGLTGDGTGHIGNGLPTKPVDLTRPELEPVMNEAHIFKIVKEGMKANGGTIYMIAWKTVLRDEEIKDVAAYTARLAAEGRARRGARK